MVATLGTAKIVLSAYRPRDDVEAADFDRLAAVLRHCADPWSREIPMHLTASALIVHPASGQVLLRWHPRQQAWLQIGGHGDPGETDPIEIVLREGREETGLADLRPWPDAELLHVVVVPVPAKGDEPAHEHAAYVVADSRDDRSDEEFTCTGSGPVMTIARSAQDRSRMNAPIPGKADKPTSSHREGRDQCPYRRRIILNILDVGTIGANAQIRDHITPPSGRPADEGVARMKIDLDRGSGWSEVTVDVTRHEGVARPVGTNGSGRDGEGVGAARGLRQG